MSTPSTDWKEVVPPGEAALHEQLAKDMTGLQQRMAAKHGGPKRGLHSKANVVLRAKFEVKGGLPETHRVGLFSEAKTFDAVVRFSNGGPTPAEDRRPDVRGIAVKLIGVGGKKSIPGFEHATQDFTAILSSTMPFRVPEDFVFVVQNAANPLGLLFKSMLRFGPGTALKTLGALQKGLAAPLTSLHTNRYFTPLPIRFGAYAAKYCFTPVGVSQAAQTQTADLGAELVQTLSSKDCQWDFQVQLFADEATTPIEDPRVEWTTPWTTLATLTVPKQSLDAKLAEWAEKASFDPWHAQEELRPLGAMQRARNTVYRESTKARGASGEPTEMP